MNAQNAENAGQNIPEQHAGVRAEQGGGMKPDRPIQDMEGPQINRNANGVKQDEPIADLKGPQINPNPGIPQNLPDAGGNRPVPPNRGGNRNRRGGENAENAGHAGQNIPEQRAGVRAEQGGNRQPENRADGNQNNPQNPQQPLNRQQYEHLFGQDPNADDDHAQLPQMGGGVQAEQDGNAGVQPVPNQENPIEQPAQNAPDGNDVVHEQPANGDAPVNDANLAGIGNPRRRRTVPPANNRRRRPTNPAVQEMFRQLDEGQNPENPDDDPERPLPPQQRNQP